MPMHKEYRREWFKAGYTEKMGSAEVLLPPAKSLLRVYHITSAEYGVSDLALHRMKVARVSDLNDPFELLALNIRDKPMRKRLAEFKTTYDSDTGLLCFSQNWTNPVLWSHYGQKHRGICLGFDLKKGAEQRVDYQDKRIRAALGDGTSPVKISADVRALLLCTKFSHWRYEEEVRLFVSLKDPKLRSEGKLHFFPFGGDLELREVILGPECTLPLADVRKFVDSVYAGVTTYKARLAVRSFSIVPLEKTVP